MSLPGTLGMLVGFMLYGFATLRAGLLPRWCGFALIVSMPVSLPLATYGTALFGLILVVLGYALRLRNDAITAQPPRVGRTSQKATQTIFQAAENTLVAQVATKGPATHDPGAPDLALTSPRAQYGATPAKVG